MGALQSLQRCLARPLAERLGGSFVLEELSGGESLPTDKSWSGCIHYDPVGRRMSAVLSVMFEAGRRSHSFMPQRGAPTPQYFAYSGGYSVDEQEVCSTAAVSGAWRAIIAVNCSCKDISRMARSLPVEWQIPLAT